jgi:hypothetical protein
MDSLDSKAPSKTLNVCSYHAMVLVVTFFRNRLSSIKTDGIFRSPEGEVVENMGG